MRRAHPVKLTAVATGRITPIAVHVQVTPSKARGASLASGAHESDVKAHPSLSLCLSPPNPSSLLLWFDPLVHVSGPLWV